MLQLQLLFFTSLAASAVALDWFGFPLAVRKTLAHFALSFVANWLLAAALLFAGMFIFMREEPALYFPTLAAAHAVPVFVVCAALAVVHNRWSRKGRVLLALALSAVFALFAFMFVLVATCAVQSNCL